jgi:hypothetical protein
VFDKLLDATFESVKSIREWVDLETGKLNVETIRGLPGDLRDQPCLVLTNARQLRSRIAALRRAKGDIENKIAIVAAWHSGPNGEHKSITPLVDSGQLPPDLHVYLNELEQTIPDPQQDLEVVTAPSMPSKLKDGIPQG